LGDSAGELAGVAESGLVGEVLELEHCGDVDPFGSPPGESSFDRNLNKISINLLKKSLRALNVSDRHVFIHDCLLSTVSILPFI
jgi:hypothetical protein